MCAVKISTYVDKNVSARLYMTRKIRGAQHKKRLRIAIVGLNEAISLYRERGRQTEAVYLSTLTLELSAQLACSPENCSLISRKFAAFSGLFIDRARPKRALR